MNNAYVNSICAVTINSLMLVRLKEQASLMLSRFCCRDISGRRCWPRWHCWEKQSKQGELCLLVVLRSVPYHHYWWDLFLDYYYRLWVGGTQKKIFRKMSWCFLFLSVQSKSIGSGSPCPPENKQLWLFILQLWFFFFFFFLYVSNISQLTFFRIERYNSELQDKTQIYDIR